MDQMVINIIYIWYKCDQNKEDALRLEERPKINFALGCI